MAPVDNAPAPPLRPGLLIGALVKLRSDPLARLALVLLAVSLGLRLLDFGALRGIPAFLLTRGPVLVFSALVLVALQRGLRRIARAWERRFWHKLTVAFLCWALAELVLSLWPATALAARQLVAETLFACFYTLFILAIERRPHRRSEPPVPGVERHLTWPGVTVFVLGLLVYFVLIPAASGPAGQAASAFAGLLYLPLDAYLAVRLLYLARGIRTSRWYVIYLTLAAAAVALLCRGLLGIFFLFVGGSSFAGLAHVLPDGLLDVSWVLVVLAARCRHLSFAPRRAVLDSREVSFEGLSAQTLSFALCFPLLHLACINLGLFGAAGAMAREVLVAFWVVLLGAIAFLQHRFLEKLARALWLGQRRLEDQLHGSEGDLRLMIERRRTDASLRESRVRFTKVFHACASAMTVSTLPDGRFVEINRGFERLTGYRGDEIIDHTFEELALFSDEANTAKEGVLQNLDAVSELEAVLLRRDGARRDVLVSREVIDMDGTPCLLTVLHDVTASRRAHARAKVRADLLADAADVVYAIDAQGRFTYWNPQAERVYGWTAAAVYGRFERDVLYEQPCPQRTVCGDALTAGDDWIGTLTQVDKDGETLSLAGWWTPTVDAAGQPSGCLVIGTSARVGTLV